MRAQQNHVYYAKRISTGAIANPTAMCQYAVVFDFGESVRLTEINLLLPGVGHNPKCLQASSCSFPGVEGQGKVPGGQEKGTTVKPINWVPL